MATAPATPSTAGGAKVTPHVLPVPPTGCARIRPPCLRLIPPIQREHSRARRPLNTRRPRAPSPVPSSIDTSAPAPRNGDPWPVFVDDIQHPRPAARPRVGPEKSIQPLASRAEPPLNASSRPGAGGGRRSISWSTQEPPPALPISGWSRASFYALATRSAGGTSLHVIGRFCPPNDALDSSTSPAPPRLFALSRVAPGRFSS